MRSLLNNSNETKLPTTMV